MSKSKNKSKSLDCFKGYICFCLLRLFLGLLWIICLVTGFSMTPPILNSTKNQLVIDANDTLSITCRGQHLLGWAWPDQSLEKAELSKQEGQQSPAYIHNQRGLWVKECQGEPGKPYCKILVLTQSGSDDTGYYHCFYQDIKAIIDGTTAASIYVFVRGLFFTLNIIDRICCKQAGALPELFHDFLKLLPEDSPIELMRGDVLVLNCTALVEFNMGVEFKWAYPGQKENRVVNFQPMRNKLAHATEAISTLTIRNVNMNDSGFYTCSANSVDRSLARSTLIIVHKEPFISLDYKNGSAVEATVGQKSIMLSVRMSAYPGPLTHWSQDHNLEIRDVRKEDAGNYTLVLKNSAAFGLSCFLCEELPQIHEKEAAAPSNPYRWGSRQTLTCTATGYPPPQAITWQWRPWSPCGLNITHRTLAHRGQQDKIPLCQDWIDLDPEHTVNAIESMDTWSEPVDGKLKTVGRIIILSANVSAMYKCSAENKVGKDERLIYFYVTTIPEGFNIEMEPVEEPLELDSVRLKCSADNYTYNNMRWYRLDPQAMPPEDCKSLYQYAKVLGGELSFQASRNSWVLELNFTSVQLQDEGNYVCEVQNQRSGEKHCHRKYLSVKALEAPRYRHNPTNQTVNVSSSLQMECDVEGTPSPQLSWFKDNQPLFPVSGILLQDSNRMLSIQRVREEDAGLYTCTACNQRGCIHSSAIVSVIGSDDDTNVEIVILIGTGVIAIFFWVLLILIFCNVKRVTDIKTGYLSIIMDPGEVPLEEQCEYLPYDSSQWEIPRDRLRLGKVLGHGAFGKVIEASVYGNDKKSSLGTVAVKMLKEGATASEHKALMSELKILIHIGNHLNVVNLLGACTKTNGPLMVVVEYCKYGNLSNYLRAKREFFLPYRDCSPKTQSQVRRMLEAGHVEQIGRKPSSPSYPSNLSFMSQLHCKMSQKMDDLWKSPLTVEDLICYSFQVARGMEFLASRKCIHRDLAARNILLSENNVVKICDFGLARDIYKDPDYVRKGNARLPLKWMAPESIFDKVYTSQSDVWSFGVLLWEIFSLGASPYPGIQIDEEFCKRLKDGTRMRAPDNASPEIYGIMLACWQGEPKERPTFPVLLEILGDLLQDNSLPVRDFANIYRSSFSFMTTGLPLYYIYCTDTTYMLNISFLHRNLCNLFFDVMFLPRYYNCVSFSGSLMVSPSTTCHSRVKTFEQLPIEMISHKSPHDSQTDSGMVLASEELERFEHQQKSVILKK
uniref:Vascular endothelial growth factor receptor 3 n=1 Tax=Electrophorus electricus TaxID=8005 RepID=A0A4W4F492_ELEEL